MNDVLTIQQQEILEELKQLLTTEESIRLFRAFFAGVLMREYGRKGDPAGTGRAGGDGSALPSQLCSS